MDAVVRAVVDKETIRANMPASVPLLLLEFRQCAQQYTGCVKTDELVFDECAEFIVTRFGHLNIQEIRQAFRLAAAGELGDVKLDAYFGTFTVGMLGKVLAAYKDYRDRVTKEILAAESEHEYAETLELASKNHDREEWIRNQREKLIANESLAAQQCTVYDFQCFEAEIMVALTDDEKKPLWADAWRLTICEYQDRLSRNDYSAKKVLQNPSADKGFQENRLNWYKRLLVVAWAAKQRV